jgi:hypothetical protein
MPSQARCCVVSGGDGWYDVPDASGRISQGYWGASLGVAWGAAPGRNTAIVPGAPKEDGMADPGIVGLAGLGIVLGLRHGIDWDHLAAITDITSAAVTTEERARSEGDATVPARDPAVTTVPDRGAAGLAAGRFDGLRLAGGEAAGGAVVLDARDQRRREMRDGFALATIYALGHASLVVALGLLAIWAGALLPDWIDPLMGRIVGLTLLFLGCWIIYSLARYGRDFRLQSRWMVLIGLGRNGWERLKAGLAGRPASHTHDVTQYGPRTAFGIGLLHGIGAETGSQALLLAGAVGASTRASGTALLLFFTIGLLLSNSLVAAFSVLGFVSASARRTVYVVLGILAAIFSLLVGFLFLTGQEAVLPNFEAFFDRLFGAIGNGE